MYHFWGHFKTVAKHKHYVFLNCVKAGIPMRGLLHDLSKFSPTEFITGAKYWQGTRSPNEREREIYGHSKAWMHHKGRNRHHYEYWNDYNPTTKKVEPVEMPRVYFAEMFCDRVAASKIYRGKNYSDSDPLDYYKRKSESMFINENTQRLLEYFLVMLSEKGEREAFDHLKAYVKRGTLPSEFIK